MKKKTKIYLILIVFTLIIIFLGMKNGYLFGSNTDWFNQHTVFPEYFRNLFYETGNLIPNFAFNLGSGQNIFNFSYYGLLNPIVLISYFLPFIDMTIYLEIVNVIMIIVSVLLCFIWLKRNDLDDKSSVLGSILFLLATPLIYHAHRHFMFVSYMPFLLLGLIGIDLYFEKKYQSLLIISVFLMIMTSYYYSIGGLLVLAFYYIYNYLKNEKFSWLNFIKKGLCFLYPYLLGILLASFFLLPTIYVVLSGRGKSSTSVNFLSLIIPKFNFKTFLYDSYGLGLSIISMFALIFSIFSYKKERRFLSVICIIISVIPIFIYLLNGTLYIRSKVLIPFLPLFILLTTSFFKEITKIKTFHISLYIFLFLLILFISAFIDSSNWIFNLTLFFDSVITFFCLFMYQKRKKDIFLYMIIFGVSIINITINQSENYVSIKKYQDVNDPLYKNTTEKLNELNNNLFRMKQLDFNVPILNKVYGMNYYQTSLYSSIQNMYYHEFFRNFLGNSISNRNNLMNSSNSNLLFDTYMGILYVFGEEKSLGYEKIEGLEKEVYENKHAFPIMYTRSQSLSKEEFDKITYPYQTDLLLRNVIVDKKTLNTDASKIKKVDLSYKILDKDDFIIEKNKDGYRLEVLNKAKLEIEIQEDLTNQILFLDFYIDNEVSCKDGDRMITINGKVNKLTCKEWLYQNENYHFKYAIIEKGKNNILSIEIDKGIYEIKDINTYLLDYEEIEKLNDDINPFIFDKEKTKGDYISGSIVVEEDGYFVTSIPYDDGFTITVNGEKQDYELTNKAFVGFPIKKGSYDISITYHAPWLKEGKMLSLIGLGLFFVVILQDYKRKKR